MTVSSRSIPPHEMSTKTAPDRAEHIPQVPHSPSQGAIARKYHTATSTITPRDGPAKRRNRFSRERCPPNRGYPSRHRPPHIFVPPMLMQSPARRSVNQLMPVGLSRGLAAVSSLIGSSDSRPPWTRNSGSGTSLEGIVRGR